MRQVCVLCHSMGSPVDPTERAFPVEFTLQELGVEGKFAHVYCVGVAQQRQKKAAQRAAMPPQVKSHQKKFFTKPPRQPADLRLVPSPEEPSREAQ